MSNYTIEPIDAMGTNNAVYEYGVRLDFKTHPEFRDILDKTFRANHILQNELIAKAREIITEEDKWVESRMSEEAADAQKEVDRLYELRRLARAANDQDTFSTLTKKINKLKREIIWPEQKKVRSENSAYLNEAFRNDYLKANKGRALYEMKVARLASPVQLGDQEHYIGADDASNVLDRVIQAVKKSRSSYDVPQFKKYAETTSRYTEYLYRNGGTKPLRIGSVMSGGCSRFSMSNERVPLIVAGNEVWGKKDYRKITFRLGSRAGGFKEISGTMLYHREVPEDAKINRIRLIEKVIADKTKHYIQFVIESEEGISVDVAANRNEVVALDIGWYFEEDGRRVVATATSSDPSAGSILRLPESVDKLFDSSEDRQGERDTERDDMVKEIQAISFKDAPEDLAHKLVYLKGKKPEHVSQSWLRKLASYWSHNHSSYMPDVCKALYEWKHIDTDIWREAAFLRRRAMNQRKWVYQNFALNLVKAHEYIVIDKPDLEKTARVKSDATGKHNNLGQTARNSRVRAAPSILEQAIKWAAARAGSKVVQIKGPTSSECPICDSSLEKEHAASRVCVCTGCGAEFDRDLGAAAKVWKEATARFDKVQHIAEEALEKLAGKKAKSAEIKAMRTASRQKVAEPLPMAAE